MTSVIDLQKTVQFIFWRKSTYKWTLTIQTGIVQGPTVRTMEYYSTFEGKDILTPATAWMNLEDIMLSEICQTQKDKYCVIPVIRGP